MRKRCVVRLVSALVVAAALACAPPGRLPWPEAPSDDVLSVDDRLCLAWYPSYGDDDEAKAARARDLALLDELGVRRVRTDVYWHRIEAERGRYDVGYLDAALDDMSAAGVSLLGILAYSNPLYSAESDGDPYVPPDEAAPYGAFAKAVSEALSGRVSSWELWNEPNVGFRFFKPTPDPERFAALALEGAAGVRAGCPDCEVILGGLAPFGQLDGVTMDGDVFLERLLAAAPSLAGDVDGVGWHAYTLYPPCSPPEYSGPNPCVFWEESSGFVERSYAEQIGRVREIVDAAPGGRDKPIHVTEMGWPSWDTVSEREQARFLARGMLLGTALDARTLCWWQLYEGPRPDAFPPEDAFGLVRESGEKKLAFHALATLSSVLGAARFLADVTEELGLSREEGEHALLFLDGERAITALWSELPRVATVPAHPASARALVLLDGARQDLPVDTADVEVPLSDSPVYLVEDRGRR